MRQIASFSVDHTALCPGLYLSRKDKNVATYDLRVRRPNIDELLTNSQLHSVEHLLATLLRNSEYSEAIIYFGPMGCQTGFYLLVDSDILSDGQVLILLQNAFTYGMLFDGKMPGNSEKECGNYKNLSIDEAKKVCKEYAFVLAGLTAENMRYK